MEEETYEIECLQDHKVGRDGKTYLFVKWVGFTEEENTWEPVETMREDVPHLVKKYFEVREERKNNNSRKDKKRKPIAPSLPRQEEERPRQVPKHAQP